jgi:YcaO-like protein with predicted kinase domain
MASALMEAIELFHGEELTARTRVGSYHELSANVPAVGPSLLCGTGRPLPEGATIPWIEGYDLLRQESCWIPWEIVHTDYSFPTNHSGEHFLSGTNGIASGNHLLEALSAGVCELIERDAVAVWNARSLRERARCRLDLASVDDEDCCTLLERYERAGLMPRVWDVTSDIGITAFVCDIPAETVKQSNGLRRFRGAGCHPNRAIALARALTEAAQIRLTYISGSRDDLPPTDYEETAGEKLGGALLDAASQAVEPVSFRDAANFDADDLALDVAWELKRLLSVGIEQAIAVDLTRTDFGIPVIKIVVPGLEWDCTHPDYTPGPRAHSASRHVR